MHWAENVPDKRDDASVTSNVSPQKQIRILVRIKNLFYTNK